ncbi:MAG: PH domain-containing protein [Candidatus Altiarchaeota archaeon]|nr:PH domain-containing protein [Candidatus Altiarchaeota archaeon]
MGLMESIFFGKKIEVPEDVKRELIPGEQILHSVRQARIDQPITPDSIIITTERVMIRRPDWFGLTARNRDYRYDDMGNVTVHRGILNATIDVKMRFLSHDLVLSSIPKEEAPKIASTIQEGIDGRFEGIGGGKVRTRESPDEGVSVSEKNVDEKLLSILKYRYVKGEITREEYDRMKRDITG